MWSTESYGGVYKVIERATGKTASLVVFTPEEAEMAGYVDGWARSYDGTDWYVAKIL